MASNNWKSGCIQVRSLLPACHVHRLASRIEHVPKPGLVIHVHIVPLPGRRPGRGNIDSSPVVFVDPLCDRRRMPTILPPCQTIERTRAHGPVQSLPRCQYHCPAQSRRAAPTRQPDDVMPPAEIDDLVVVYRESLVHRHISKRILQSAACLVNMILADRDLDS